LITPLTSSLIRVTLFWYSLGLLVLFFGPPRWVAERYDRLMALLPVPSLETSGIIGAANVQWHMLLYWTVPLVIIWVMGLLFGGIICEVRFRIGQYLQKRRLKPKGTFKGVVVGSYSIGQIPHATVPEPVGQSVQILSSLSPKRLFSSKKTLQVVVTGKVKEVVGWLTPDELAVCQDLIRVLFTSPNHYAGAGHGVGLLEHTLNVMREAAQNCTPEFRLPVIAALAHDVGKLLTFQSDGEGGWVRVGLHSREGARILATLPSFDSLPLDEQRALLLAVKYGHAPSKMPVLAGDREASMLALRILNALTIADRAATAAEKDRNLERLQPEDILWQDFVNFLREAPVVQLGKSNSRNQINNPHDSPYLFIYEIVWREAAIKRLPEEVAAALDLNRRDVGQTAKYTRILTDRLRKEGLLLEEFTDSEGNVMRAPKKNPLWDIKSGRGLKAPGFRGVLVLHTEALWQKLNYRLGTHSPYPVTIVAPNALGAPFEKPDAAELGLLTREKTSVPSTKTSDNVEVNRSTKVEGDAVDSSSNSAYAYLAQSASSIAGSDVEKDKPKPAKKPAIHLPALPERDPEALSVSERRLGVAIADAVAVEAYPHLEVGQKYYTAQSKVVLSKGVEAGAPYPDGEGGLKKIPVPEDLPIKSQAQSTPEPALVKAESVVEVRVVSAPTPAQQETRPPTQKTQPKQNAAPKRDQSTKKIKLSSSDNVTSPAESNTSTIAPKPRRRRF